MSSKFKISLLYLGKRGGGAQFTLELAEELAKSSYFELSHIYLRGDIEIKGKFDQSKARWLFDSGYTLKTATKLLGLYFTSKKKVLQEQFEPATVVLVPMISPLGIFVERTLVRRGITIIRFLHDASQHPGDNWPSNSLIRKIINNSKYLIALSNSVKAKILDINPQVQVGVYKLPVFNFAMRDIKISLPSRYILFIGRVREYKGIPLLVEAFENLENQDLKLIIAGEGNLEGLANPAVERIARWLDESEIAQLINQAEVVVFPYIEASQSGLIPYCIAEQRKIVITPLEGLKEQLGSYSLGFVAKSFSVSDLTNSLAEALQKNYDEIEITSPTPDPSLEEVLFHSGIFHL